MSETREFNQTLIAGFRASQYLGDTLCQQTMTQLSRTWKGKNSAAAQALIARFHPLTMEEIKQARDIDAFFFQSIQGTLNRVHFVKKGGVGRLNPAPDDFHCESCHVKGWLRKEFEVSEIDGVVAPVWLCPDCAKLSAKAEEPKKAKEAESSSRPKTGLQELDENPRLMDLLFDTLGLAINEVAQTGSLIPFGILETELSERMIQGFKTGRLELGYE